MYSNNSYFIDYEKKLGQGSSGEVFLGINSVNGSQYAFKCLKDPGENEKKILLELDHKNIVKFYGCFKECENYHEAIVLEYCNKGSLQYFCQMHMGLCDNMFLLVLECLCEGIGYLRQKHLIHRDIKPDHMMVNEDIMGYFQVKICDLGDAKKVDDDQTFKTLVGTPEYMIPAMFFRYVSEGSQGGSMEDHDSKTDLWSIAVTLYHSVTTYLPFRPFDCDKTQEECEHALQKIYENRKTGVISGVQNSSDIGDIEWSTSLPCHCQLSPMLSVLASNLIGHLLDPDTTNSYDRFFDEAHQIINKKRILMFTSWNGQLQLLYLDDLSHKSVLDQIIKITSPYSKDLIVLTKQKILRAPLSDDEYFRSVPLKGHLVYQLTDDTVLLMTGKSNNEMQALIQLDISDQCDSPSDKYDTFNDMLEHSKTLMSRIYEIRRTSNYIDCQMECYTAMVASFNKNVIMDNMCLMNAALPWRIKAIREGCAMTDSLIDRITQLVGETSVYTNSLVEYKDEIKQLNGKATEGEKCGEQYYTLIVERGQMLKFTEKTFHNDDESLSNDSLDFLAHLAEELLNEIKLVPENKWQRDDKYNVFYEVEVWRRQIQLFKIYNISREKVLAKKDVILTKHHNFYNWLNQGHIIMDRHLSLQNFLQRQENKMIVLRVRFLELYDFLRALLGGQDSDLVGPDERSENIAGANTIKERIIEIKDLSERMKNIYCQERAPQS